MATIETLYKIVASVTGGNAVKALSDQIASMSTGSQNFVRGLNMAGSALKAFAAAEAVRQMVGFVHAAIDVGDQLDDMSTRTGIAVSELGKYTVAAELGGTTMDSVAKSINKLNKNLIDADDGTGTAAAAFRALNINIRDSSGQLKGADDIITEVADRFHKFPDGPTKAALAMAIFGKSGTDMIPMLNDGSEAIKKYGLVIDKDFTTAAHGFNDRLTLMGVGVKQLGIDMAKIMLPALNDAIDQIKGVTNTKSLWDGFAKGASDAIRAVSGSIVVLIEQLKNLYSYWKLISGAEYGAMQMATGHILDGYKTMQNAWTDFKKEFADHNAKSLNAAAQFYDNSYIYGNGNAKASDKINSPKGNNATPVFNPSAAANADALEKDVLKKIAVLNADTGSIKLNNAEREKAVTLAEFEAKGLSKNSELYKQLSAAIDKNTAAHRSFEAGAFKALNDYLDTATNIAQQTENVFSEGFKGMEDALVNFTKTGKLSFTDLANSIISDLQRIMIRQSITGPLAGWLGNSFGSLFGGGSSAADSMVGYMTDPLAFANGGVMTSRGSLPLHRYASGGVASSPQLALFGEGRMNEAYVPLPDGRSIPVTLKGTGGSTIQVTVNVDGTGNVQSDSDSGKKIGTLIASTVKSILINEKRPGGLLAAA